LPRDARWTARHDAKLLRGLTVLETEAVVVADAEHGGSLYRPAPTTAPRRIALRLLPYYAWNNRGAGEMTVWLPRY